MNPIIVIKKSPKLNNNGVDNEIISSSCSAFDGEL
jgi:hypothetical protein